MLSKLKRLLFFALSLTVFMLNLSVYSVKGASENYLRILTENAYIYSDINLTNKIFEVPYGYFVKVENSGEGVTRVVYGDDGNNYPVIMGYMNPEELSAVTEIPTKPFTVIKVSTEVSDILFNDGELKKAYFNVPEDTFMYYYGEYNSNTNNLCYVYCKNKLGYIDKSCLNPFSVPISPDEIIVETPENPTDAPEDNGDTKTEPTTDIGENLQIIIIVGISVISISVVYFLFKPSKNKTTGDYQADTDDE